MRRRVFSLLAVFALVLGMATINASAENDSEYADEKLYIVEGNTKTAYDGSEFATAFNYMKANPGAELVVSGTVEINGGISNHGSTTNPIVIRGVNKGVLKASPDVLNNTKQEHFLWLNNIADLTIENLTFDGANLVDYSLRLHRIGGTVNNVTAINAKKTGVDLNAQTVVERKITLNKVSSIGNPKGFGISGTLGQYIEFNNCSTAGNAISIGVHNQQGGCAGLDLGGIEVKETDPKLLVEFRDIQGKENNSGEFINLDTDISFTTIPAAIGNVADWTGTENLGSRTKGSMTYSPNAGANGSVRVELEDGTVLYFADETEAENALNVLKDNGAISDTELVKLLDALEEKADDALLNELSDLLNKVEAILNNQNSPYTEESFNKLVDAYNNVVMQWNNGAFTDAEIQALIDELNVALDGLVEVAKPLVPTDNGNATNPASPTAKNGPDTGDHTATTWYMAVGFVSLLVLVSQRKKIRI